VRSRETYEKTRYNKDSNRSDESRFIIISYFLIMFSMAFCVVADFLVFIFLELVY